MEAKAAPPPVPSRAQRKSVSMGDSPVAADDAPKSEVEGDAAAYEEQHEPVEVFNGEPAVEETVAPNCYKWYSVTVEGTEDDVVDFRVSRTLHGGAINLYVNGPSTEEWPTRENHHWNPTKGQMLSTPGQFKVTVEGVPSFIEKDDQYLVSPESNWATYDLLVEYSLLDEKTKEVQRKMRDLYAREKTSSVWSSGYNKELSEKYMQQQREQEQELQERERQMQEATEADVSLDGTPLVAAYELSTVLGRGDFTVVKKAKEKSTGKEYAVKIVNKDLAKEMGIDADVLKQQVAILKSVSHKNIAGLKEHFDTEKALCLVLELQEGGELFTRLGLSTAPYTEDVARGIVAQLLEALEYLHGQNIMHKSLIPENILYSTKDGEAIKLVGFSLAQISKDDKEQGVFGGDPGFQAPELISQQAYGKPIDMWSLGVIGYILLCGTRPFHDSNNMRLNMKIREAQYELPEDKWKEISTEAKDLLRHLMCVDVSKRLTAKSAREHPWFKKSGGAALPHVRSNLQKYYEQ